MHFYYMKNSQIFLLNTCYPKFPYFSKITKSNSVLKFVIGLNCIETCIDQGSYFFLRRSFQLFYKEREIYWIKLYRNKYRSKILFFAS
jgi:hypothetical protein